MSTYGRVIGASASIGLFITALIFQEGGDHGIVVPLVGFASFICGYCHAKERA